MVEDWGDEFDGRVWADEWASCSMDVGFREEGRESGELGRKTQEEEGTAKGN